MTKPSRLAPGFIVLALAVVIPVLGLIIDAGFTQPQLRKIENLGVRRESLYARLFHSQQRRSQNEDLASYLAARSEEGDDDDRDLDAIAYLSQLLREARLTRQELGTEETGTADGMERVKFYLRLSGNYERVLTFIRRLEQSSRLASVDAITMKRDPASGSLETRLKITMYRWAREPEGR